MRGTAFSFFAPDVVEHYFVHFRLASSWAVELAPMSTEVTPSCCKIQRSAASLVVCPFASASAFSFSTKYLISGVRYYDFRKNSFAMRESAGMPLM